MLMVSRLSGVPTLLVIKGGWLSAHRTVSTMLRLGLVVGALAACLVAPASAATSQELPVGFTFGYRCGWDEVLGSPAPFTYEKGSLSTPLTAYFSNVNPESSTWQLSTNDTKAGSWDANGIASAFPSGEGVTGCWTWFNTSGCQQLVQTISPTLITIGDETTVFEENVQVVLSLYAYGSLRGGSSASTSNRTPSPWMTQILNPSATVWAEYTKADGSTGTTPLQWTTFETGKDAENYMYTNMQYPHFGVTVSGTIKSNNLEPIRDLRIRFSNGASNLLGWELCMQGYVGGSEQGTAARFATNFAVPSFRILTSVSSAELDALDDIASGIAGQSAMMEQYYGDILAAVNSVYNRLGDIDATLAQIKAMFDPIISTLNSIQGDTSAIRSALPGYFQMVVSALDNQTLTLDQAIRESEQALETYLKPIVDYFNELEDTTGESPSSLPGHKQDLDSWQSQGAGISDDALTGLPLLTSALSAMPLVWTVLALFFGCGIFLTVVRKGLS